MGRDPVAGGGGSERLGSESSLYVPGGATGSRLKLVEMKSEQCVSYGVTSVKRVSRPLARRWARAASTDVNYGLWHAYGILINLKGNLAAFSTIALKKRLRLLPPLGPDSKQDSLSFALSGGQK